MPPTVYGLFGDESGLPRTLRRSIPYETEALTPREMWGHGHGSTTIPCRVKWSDSVTWIQDMVGSVEIAPVASGNFFPKLVRHIPERLRYGDSNADDKRIQWCTGVSQIDQGGNPPPTGNPNDINSEDRFAVPVSNWPRTLWKRYQATWETTPYFIRSDAEISQMAAGAGISAGAPELLRHVVRERKVYAREQPIPAATGGLKVVDDFNSDNRRTVGAGFRMLSMADVIYRWVRVPIGWPPPPGWLINNPLNPWPPRFNPAALAPNFIRRVRDAYIGCFNSTSFDCAAPEGWCWRRADLLYQGYEEHAYWDAEGRYVCDLTYKFRFKEGGWDRFLDAYGNWRAVSSDVVKDDKLGGTSLGRPPYQSADFNHLFQPIGPIDLSNFPAEMRIGESPLVGELRA